MRFTIRDLLWATLIVAIGGTLARGVADNTVAAIAVLLWASLAGLGIYIQARITPPEDSN